MRERGVGNGSAQEFYPIVRLPFLVLDSLLYLMEICSYMSGAGFSPTWVASWGLGIAAVYKGWRGVALCLLTLSMLTLFYISVAMEI